MQSDLIYLHFIILVFLNFIFYLNREKIFNYINIVDKPDGKIKLHKKNIFPVGGLIFFFNILIFLIFEFFFNTNVNEIYGASIFDNIIFFISILLLFLIGLYDDKYNLSYITKLILTSLIISIFLTINESFIISKLSFTFTDEMIDLSHVSKVFTILCILLFVNALNLFDGMDLQSGTYILIILFFFIFLLRIEIIFILILSCILFLFLNHKKEIFLGDSGTILLGFIISCFSIYSYNNSLILSDQIFILMMVPGIDMMRLFSMRILNGKNPFKGDRNHMHHILSKKYGYLKSLIIINSIIIILILSSFFFKVSTLIIIPMYLLLYFLIIYEKKNNK